MVLFLSACHAFVLLQNVDLLCFMPTGLHHSYSWVKSILSAKLLNCTFPSYSNRVWPIGHHFAMEMFIECLLNVQATYSQFKLASIWSLLEVQYTLSPLQAPSSWLFSCRSIKPIWDCSCLSELNPFSATKRRIQPMVFCVKMCKCSLTVSDHSGVETTDHQNGEQKDDMDTGVPQIPNEEGSLWGSVDNSSSGMSKVTNFALVVVLIR